MLLYLLRMFGNIFICFSPASVSHFTPMEADTPPQQNKRPASEDDPSDRCLKKRQNAQSVLLSSLVGSSKGTTLPVVCQYNCAIHEVSEHYTSKTCGRCAKVHWKLGDAKTFRCPSCNFQLDRDWNGARNIFLMNLEKYVGVASPIVG